MTKLSNRLSDIIDFYELSINSFEQKIGCSSGVIRKILSKDTDISAKWILKISENFPKIDLHWLITGEGNMFKVNYKSEKKTDVRTNKINNEPLDAKSDSEISSLVKVVEIQARSIESQTRSIENLTHILDYTKRHCEKNNKPNEALQLKDA